MNDVRYYTIVEYAKQFKVHRSTVWRWIRDGKLELVEIAKGVKRIRVDIKEE